MKECVGRPDYCWQFKAGCWQRHTFCIGVELAQMDLPRLVVPQPASLPYESTSYDVNVCVFLFVSSPSPLLLGVS